MQMDEYDALILGSGQGGTPLAHALAGAGWRTVLVERAHIGGTCINTGCTPTKTMIASARAAYLARRAGEYGIRVGDVSVDMEMVRRRKQDVVSSFRASGERRVEQADNLEFLAGHARFVGERRIEVRCHDGDTRLLTAPRIVVNTGTRSARPHLLGLEAVPALDSTSIMELDALPDHLVILGGGYIGVEFAQMFRRFGSRVTLVHRGPQLLAREDPDIAGALADILREDGVDVRLNAHALRVDCQDGDLCLTVRGETREPHIHGSHLLLAVGRTPNTDDLDLEATGVQPDERGYVPVDERLATSVPGVYALGDVTGGPQFTHISYDDFRVLRDHLLGADARATTGRLVPYTVFTDPELGRVGMTEREARESGRRVKVATMPMDWVSRAVEVGETRGLLKAVVDADSGQILGCALLGIQGGELMAMVQIAMMGKLPYTALRDGIFAHPTLAESLNNLFARIDTA